MIKWMLIHIIPPCNLLYDIKIFYRIYAINIDENYVNLMINYFTCRLWSSQLALCIASCKEVVFVVYSFIWFVIC